MLVNLFIAKRHLWVRWTFGCIVCCIAIAAMTFAMKRQAAQRRKTNSIFLVACSPEFAGRAAQLLDELEARGYNPKIGEAWRSVADQAVVIQQGSSSVVYSRHNEVDTYGRHASSALDLLPFSQFYNRERSYEVVVACLSQKYGLETGIEWGLNNQDRILVRQMVADCSYVRGHTGWDPLHVQLLRQSKGSPSRSTNGQAHQDALSTVTALPSIGMSQKVNADELMVGDPPIIGNANAPIKLVMFTDFECGYCGQLAAVVRDYILPDSPGGVELVVRQFPLKEHKNARNEAEFATCVQVFDRQEFWHVFNYLLEHQGHPDEIDNALQALSNRALVPAVANCITNHSTARQVDADIDLGEKNYVIGTPTMFVNGNRLVGAVNAVSLRAFINEHAKD